jgi:hypothetical protein
VSQRISRKTKRPLRPLRIAEAMEAMNEAAVTFAENVQTIVFLLRDNDISPKLIKMLADKLDAAEAVFRAAFWPEGD